MQVFPGLRQEQFDQLISTACQNEGLEVIRHTVSALLAELFEGVHAYFWGEFVLQELSIHELGADFTFDEHDCFDDIVVGEEPESRGFLVDVPYNY